MLAGGDALSCCRNAVPALKPVSGGRDAPSGRRPSARRRKTRCPLRRDALPLATRHPLSGIETRCPRSRRTVRSRRRTGPPEKPSVRWSVPAARRERPNARSPAMPATPTRCPATATLCPATDTYAPGRRLPDVRPGFVRSRNAVRLCRPVVRAPTRAALWSSRNAQPRNPLPRGGTRCPAAETRCRGETTARRRNKMSALATRPHCGDTMSRELDCRPVGKPVVPLRRRAVRREKPSARSPRRVAPGRDQVSRSRDALPPVERSARPF
jgi:hypothetical protein